MRKLNNIITSSGEISETLKMEQIYCKEWLYLLQMEHLQFLKDILIKVTAIAAGGNGGNGPKNFGTGKNSFNAIGYGNRAVVVLLVLLDGSGGKGSSGEFFDRMVR